MTDRTLTVAGPAVRAFQDAVRRRSVEREPVAYIVGRRGFRRLEIEVDRRALVPRPETELLVEVALGLPHGRARCSTVHRQRRGRPGAEGRAPRPGGVGQRRQRGGARARAARTSRRLGLEVRVARRPTCSTGVPDEFDAILANPPYVADSERAVAGARDPAPRAAAGAVRGRRRARCRSARCCAARRRVEAAAGGARGRRRPGRGGRRAGRRRRIRRASAQSPTWRESIAW